MTRAAGLALALALAVLAGPANRGDGETIGPLPGCPAPPALLTIGASLAHLAARLALHERLTIVALGSSSTLGTGASAAAMSYPSRLEADLRMQSPEMDIRVVNRGKSGEEVAQMLTRLDRDVIALHPDLVIWQLGTNAVLHQVDVSGEPPLIQRGIARITAAGSDLVLMDLQYAPRVLARPAYAVMEQEIATAAQRSHVGLFRRFELMRFWRNAQPTGDWVMVAPDGLHMNDRGYGCLAAALAEALAANRAAAGAAAERGPPIAAAGIGALHAPR